MNFGEFFKTRVNKRAKEGRQRLSRNNVFPATLGDKSSFAILSRVIFFAVCPRQ